jgi:hypothetical protein
MSNDQNVLDSKNKDITPQAQLFTLRIWITKQKSDILEWRGRIEHVQSGEVEFCRNWETFIAYVERMLRNQL